MTRIEVNGLEAMRSYLDLMPERARNAASLAINQTTDRRAMSLVRENMREEIAFPKGYLEDKKRLGVTKRSRPDDLEAIITGRSRPTSLARFAQGSVGRGGRVSLRVNPGRSRTLSRAFLVRLKAGQQLTDELFNVGLAIRLRPGERIENKKQMTRTDSGLYLLYGPSVDQVFRTVSVSVSPEIATALVDEFKRQFARLGGAR